jgi:hypothetical protein
VTATPATAIRAAAPENAMPKLPRLTLALRVTMEAAIVAALAMWGYHVGPHTVSKVVLALAAPAIGFGIWGAVDFRQVGRFAETLRLAEELAISGLAALAWYAAGAALAIVSLAYHGLVYLGGGRLLKPRPARQPSAGRTRLAAGPDAGPRQPGAGALLPQGDGRCPGQA